MGRLILVVKSSKSGRDKGLGVNVDSSRFFPTMREIIVGRGFPVRTWKTAKIVGDTIYVGKN